MDSIILGKKNEKNGHLSYLDFENAPNDTNSIKLGINELKKIQKTTINGKLFPELFEYDGFSIWWFFYPEVSNKFIKCINFIKNFSEFIEQNNLKIIKIDNEFNYFEIIRQMAKKNNIKLEFSQFEMSKHNLRKSFFNALRKHNSKQIIQRKIKNRKKIFFEHLDEIPKIENKIAFVSYPVYRRESFDFLTNTFRKKEFLIDEIIELAGEKEDFVGIDLFSFIHLDDNVLLERLNSNLNWFPIEAILKQFKKHDKQISFLEDFNSVINNKNFQKLFSYRNFSYWSEISEILNVMKFEYYLPYWFLLLESLQEFFKKNKPQKIFLFYETGSQSLAIINICKKLGIKTIGMQHGIIHSEHPFYMHDEFANPKNPFGFPLPDKLLLFGEIPKKILLSNGYPENKLEIFCNPIFLPFYNNKIKTDPKSIIENYNLTNDRKFILFAPPGLSDYIDSKINYNEKILKQLFHDFKDDNKLLFLIKPHPSDDPNEYQKIIENFSTSNFKIINSGLLELIYISKIVISTFSTTIIDAMSLEKPVIQVTFPGINFHRPYDEFNAVLQTPLVDLSKNILSLLSDATMQSKLIKNGSNFVKGYYNLPYDRSLESLKRTILAK